MHRAYFVFPTTVGVNETFLDDNGSMHFSRIEKRFRRMHAVVITSHGGIEGISVHEVETPQEPAADRVRVRVHAAGLNRADILQRLGKYPAPPGYPKNIPGLEFAGEVDAIGQEVRSWKIGDRVLGITAGAQAEFVVIPRIQSCPYS